MTYIIVTSEETVVAQAESYDDAMIQATRLFGDDIEDWLRLNLRIEENR